MPRRHLCASRALGSPQGELAACLRFGKPSPPSQEVTVARGGVQSSPTYVPARLPPWRHRFTPVISAVALLSGLNPFPWLKVVLVGVTQGQRRKFKRACTSLSGEKRPTIVLNGTNAKGDFYYLHVENKYGNASEEPDLGISMDKDPWFLLSKTLLCTASSLVLSEKASHAASSQGLFSIFPSMPLASPRRCCGFLSCLWISEIETLLTPNASRWHWLAGCL